MKPDYEHIQRIRAEAKRAYAANCAWCLEIETLYHVPPYDMYKYYQGIPTEED